MVNRKLTGLRIKRARKAQDISQETLAGKLGDLSFQAVSSWETGKFVPDTEHLPALAKELDLSLDALFTDKEPKWECGPVNYCPDRMFTFVKGRAQMRVMPQTLAVLDLLKKVTWEKPRKSKYGFETKYTVHPLTLACHALAMKIEEDRVIAVCLAHDLLEDGYRDEGKTKRVKPEDLPVDAETLEAVKLVSKNMWDRTEPGWERKYYDRISRNPVACLVKCLDRVNNLAGMADFFSREKMVEYTEETDRYYPALLEALKRTEYNDAWWLLRYQMMTLNETYKRMLMCRRKKMEVKKIYFDMDGVLADFDKGVRELCHMETPPHDAPKELDDEMWRRIRDAGNFYDRLDLMPGAKELFGKLREKYGDKVEILTGVPKKERGIDTAETDKENWVRRLLDEKMKFNPVARKNKQNFSGDTGYILIDDLEKNIKEWEAMGGTGIRHISAEETLAELERLGIL